MSTLAQRYTLVREAALKAVAELPHHATLGDAEIATIAQQAAGLGLSQLQAYVADAAKTYAKNIAAKPFNYSAATRAEIEAHRLAMGWPLAGHGAKAFTRTASTDSAGGGDRQAGSSAYKTLPTGAAAADPAYLRSVGLGGMVGAQLVALGFKTREQVAQIVRDADKLHLAPREAAVDLARLRKAEGERTEGHVDALKHYGDALGDLERQRKLAEQIKDAKQRAERLHEIEEKRRKAEDEIKAHCDQRVLTPDGKKSFDKLRDRIRAQDHHKAELHGVQKVAHDTSQAALVAENRSVGGERKVEAAHRKTVASLKANPIAVTQSAADELAAMADQKPEPIKPSRQAVNHKASNPTV